MEPKDKEAYLTEIENFIHKKARGFKSSGVPHEDLFQAGVLGALDALESYDQEKGVKFLTYAHDFIVAAIREEANQRVVSTPAWFRSQIMGPVLRTLDRITAEKGSEPTVGEVTEDEELRTELVQNVTALQNTNDEAVTEQIELALQQAYLHGWLSLEDSLVEPADEDESTEDKVAQMLAYEQMELALNQVLTDRELLALTMRYGLNGQDESTLKEIATELGVSIPHTHRIVMAALDKIARDPKLRRVTRGLGYD